MDINSIHRQNDVLYSKIFDQSQEKNEGFSSASSHDPPLAMEGFEAKSHPIICSSFYDPFDPFYNNVFENGINNNNLMHGSDQSIRRSLEFDSRVSSQRMEDHCYDRMNDESLMAFREMNEPNYISKSNEGEDSNNLISNHNGDEEKKKNDGRRNKETAQTRNRKRKSEIIKGQWAPEEDRLLVELVEKHGVKKWSAIAQMLTGRIGKQCRERWFNHLKPDIKKDLWTEEEDKILIESHIRLGNKWAEIARSLPGRSENTIKNHWNATKRRQLSSRRNKNDSESNSSPLQKYIRSLMSSESKAKGIINLDNSCSVGSNKSSTADMTKNACVKLNSTQANSSCVSNLNTAEKCVGGVDESFNKLMQSSSSTHDGQIRMQADLQKMDFMEMLSYGYI